MNTILHTTRLLLVRHGETAENVAQIMQGQTQGALNDNGIRQARQLAQRLALEPIDAFISSDLRRAVDTCRLLAEPHGKDFVTTPLLRERDWGSFTGRFIPSLQGEPWPDDIETLEQLKQRADRFLSLIRKDYCGLTVVAVGHGIINKAIQSVWLNKPMNEIQKMTNTEVRTLYL